MACTISQIAKKFGLSRSTLLYYDKIGLLSPKQRSGSFYRIYSEDDCRRMEEIMRLRSAGISLQEIARLIGGEKTRRAEILRQRLNAINKEMNALRQQQNCIMDLLGDKTLAGSMRVLTKEKWIACLRKAGLDEDGMDRWHQEFEASAPEAHQDFLESLGLTGEEIRLIRKRAKSSTAGEKSGKLKTPLEIFFKGSRI